MFFYVLLKYLNTVAGGGGGGWQGGPIVETHRKIVNVVENCQSCQRGGGRFKMLSSGKLLVCRKICLNI